MKLMIQYRIQETQVQVIQDDGEIVIMNGILIEGDQLCTIYDLDDKSFSFACALIEDLDQMLSFQGLSMRVEEPSDEKMLYVCNECHEMHEDKTYVCQVCDSESMRIVPQSQLIN
ncbi:hypothetical protein [Sporosarcina sp. YIM B06819]|uniref:hypothetical protein n=1 Tax=Sporosarcina sp. YIM B06819 TaxID=3081769 RepID=UPI00298C40EA|nr:hypothetical protein [Sporosarcina sp. YIM B06819]